MKHLEHCLFVALLAMPCSTSAIIIRDDVVDQEYQAPASALPALVDFPGEGHGVLISPQWVVTAAHVACMRHHLHDVTINGLPRKVASVVVHPGYQTPSSTLVEQTIASGDATALMAFLASSDDIALVKLESSITDIEPISLYRGSDEIGKTVQLLGKGATGSGKEAGVPDGPRRTSLRRAFNVVSNTDARWISYTFDSPESAIPLEGMTGSGDSGGPVLIEVNGRWRLAGLASWVSSPGDLRTYPGARYGDSGVGVRISQYISWIESTIAAEEQRQPLPQAGD